MKEGGEKMDVWREDRVRVWVFGGKGEREWIYGEKTGLTNDLIELNLT